MADEIKTVSVNEDMVNIFHQRQDLLNEGSSDILNSRRQAAIGAFTKQGVPTTKNENYKYTDLSKSFHGDFEHHYQYKKVEVDLYEVFKCDVPELDTHLVLLVNGWYYARNPKLEGLPEGVIIGSLAQVANEHPELVEKYYGSVANPEEDPLLALNTAFAKDGIFVYVPKGVVLEKPLQVINLLRGTKNTSAVQRNLIVAEENSQVKVLFCDHTLDSHYFHMNNHTEMCVGDNAVVDWYYLQNQHNWATNLTGLYIKQGRNSRVLTNTISLHGGLVRNNLKVVLDGEYAEANITGLALTDKAQHVDNFTYIEHAKPNCHSNQVYKNILDDVSTGVFTGRIHVVRDAQRTAAFQRNNNILLSNMAKMHTKPQLVIDADDVKCSHGATVGQIDKDALFYMKARGIGDQEARLMLMFAFADEVLRKVALEPLRSRIEELVDKRLRGEVSKCQSCAIACEK